MNVFPWLRRSSRSIAETSALASVVPRLRHLREEQAWEPSTPPSTIGHRAARVQEARRKVVFHPLPPERWSEWAPARPKWFWLPLALPGLILLAVLLWILQLETPAPTTLLPGGPAPASVPVSLSESVALHQAKATLAALGQPSSPWMVVPQPGTNAVVGADGHPERYLARPNPRDLSRGLVTFTNATGQRCSVTIQMRSNGATCDLTWGE